MIHPTAIIDPRARIGTGCEIGPYCVVGPDVSLGESCRLHSHVVLDGHTTLGRDNEIFPFACLGLKTQDLKWKGGVTRTQIGDANTFRECVTVHSATSDGETTVIGNWTRSDWPPSLSCACTERNFVPRLEYVCETLPTALAAHLW